MNLAGRKVAVAEMGRGTSHRWAFLVTREMLTEGNLCPLRQKLLNINLKGHIKGLPWPLCPIGEELVGHCVKQIVGLSTGQVQHSSCCVFIFMEKISLPPPQQAMEDGQGHPLQVPIELDLLVQIP